MCQWAVSGVFVAVLTHFRLFADWPLEFAGEVRSSWCHSAIFKIRRRPRSRSYRSSPADLPGEREELISQILQRLNE